MNPPTLISWLRRTWRIEIIAVFALVSSAGCASAGDAAGVAGMDHPCEFFTTSELESLGLAPGRRMANLETETRLNCSFRSQTASSSRDFIHTVTVAFWNTDVDRLAAVLAAAAAGVDFMRREEDGLYWRELQLEAFGPECGMLAGTGESSAVEVSVWLELASSDHEPFCQTVSRLAPFIEERIVPRPAG